MMQAPNPQSWLASGLLLGSILVLFVLSTTPQSDADMLTYLALAGGLVLCLASLATFAGIQLRRLISRTTPDDRALATATRQGLEIAIVIVSGLFLWGFNGLSWWEAGLLVATVSLAEIALSVGKNPFGKSV